MKNVYIAKVTSRKRATLVLAMVATLSACGGGFLGQASNGTFAQNEEPLEAYTPAQIFEIGDVLTRFVAKIHFFARLEVDLFSISFLNIKNRRATAPPTF